MLGSSGWFWEAGVIVFCTGTKAGTKAGTMLGEDCDKVEIPTVKK